MTDRRIVTIPKAAPARVEETPRFFRATTSASIDIPGPLRDRREQGVLQHDVARSEGVGRRKARVHVAVVLRVDFERVGPRSLAGPLSQFLYARGFPPTSAKCWVRPPTVRDGPTTANKWSSMKAFADDPRYRLAQVQDAMLRDVSPRRNPHARARHDGEGS